MKRRNTVRSTHIRNTLIGLLTFAAVSAQAQVVVHGTRVIFPGDKREVSVHLQTTPKRAALVQAWTDDGNPASTPETADTPFVLRPPVFRMGPDKRQVARMQFTGAALPQDRESVYWLNILDIPPLPAADKVPDGNFMQLSVRTRLKVFYRPKGLTASAAATAHEQLNWTVVPEGNGWAVQASNPTPYYVNFATIILQVDGKEYTHEGIGMVAPQADATFTVAGLRSKPVKGEVLYTYVNDHGGNLKQTAPLAAP